MKTNLIFGYNNLISKRLLDFLKKKNQRVIILSQAKTYKKDFIFLKNYYEEKKIERIINKYKPDYIWNTVGKNIYNLHESIKVNLYQPMIIMNIVNKLKYKPRLLLLSSVAEYGSYKSKFSENDKVQPKTSYGISKNLMSQLAVFNYKNYRTNIIVVRIANVYGAGMSKKYFLSNAYDYKFNQKKILQFYKNWKRDYISVDDLIKKLYKVITKGKSGEIYNVGSGKLSSSFDIFKLILKQMNKFLNYQNIFLIKNKLPSKIFLDISKYNKI